MYMASKVKVTRSRSPSDRCWPISRERKVLETAKLVTARAITRSRFEVKRSKVNVTRPINAETESVSPTNFKLVRRLELALSNAMGRYKGRLSSCYCTLAGNTVSATPGSHKTCTQLIQGDAGTRPLGGNWTGCKQLLLVDLFECLSNGNVIYVRVST